MTGLNPTRRSKLGTLGWSIVLLAAALLVVQSGAWYLDGPGTALSNIAERTALDEDGFRQGSPSAFDVITIVTRTQAIYGAALGLLTLIVAWDGYRRGSALAWWATWVLVIAVAAAGLSFVMAGGAPVGAAYLGLATVFAAGLLLARRTVAGR